MKTKTSEKRKRKKKKNAVFFFASFVKKTGKTQRMKGGGRKTHRQKKKSSLPLRGLFFVLHKTPKTGHACLMRELRSLIRSSLLLTASASAVLFSNALANERLTFTASNSSGVGVFSLAGSCKQANKGKAKHDSGAPHCIARAKRHRKLCFSPCLATPMFFLFDCLLFCSSAFFGFSLEYTIIFMVCNFLFLFLVFSHAAFFSVLPISRLVA